MIRFLLVVLEGRASVPQEQVEERRLGADPTTQIGEVGGDLTLSQSAEPTCLGGKAALILKQRY